MILWRNIEIFHFFHFNSDLRFPHFYFMLGGKLGSLLYGDVSVMILKLVVLHWRVNIMSRDRRVEYGTFTIEPRRGQTCLRGF